MPEYVINGIPVNFPFEPYNVQRAYMEKVIDCLNNSSNGVLESPTGTGKTLSLLCSSLAWLTLKKQQVHANLEDQLRKMEEFNVKHGMNTKQLPNRKNLADTLVEQLNAASSSNPMLGAPKVIYASRTHSQISQAMRELKRTSYNHMKAAVIGSRDQLCIHPDLANESNANKIQMCKVKVTTRSCSFHNRLESQKDNPEFRNANTVLDIEDIVRIGKKLKACPYFMSKELMDDADIIFMPYNYLLDPKIRKANKIELHNTIIILDEAHNVEKMCEESASVQIASSEIAVAIDDVTHVLTPMVENNGSLPSSGDGDQGEDKDFTVDDLVLLKEILLSLEKAVDEIVVKNPLPGSGETFEGGYVFDFLEKANITHGNAPVILSLLDNLILYLANEAHSSSSVFKRGSGLQKINELLVIVFSSTADDFRKRVSKCYKVYVEFEQQKTTHTTTSKVKENGWIQPKANTTKVSKSTAKVFNYWCFSPGFGMQHLLGKNVRSIILTSGTLAPLKPLISELDIPISVNLENPHIVDTSQVCVKIISHGPDKEQLTSNYENRGNPKYIDSLGRTILSFCPVIPHGLLVFFPSYFNLNTCKDKWQATGLWSQITRIKPIFIEPKSKDAFLTTMQDYYAKIHEPGSKGAIFMAVCRGKVSEGLDFADKNGRAVIITGLPFPPFKDPKIVLKKKYLTENRTKENQLLSGDDWYFLEASRAVNQAIGRVIRHKNDYGAILLCDCRFNNPRQKNQLSTWIQGHLKNTNSLQPFGSMIGELARFFRNAERTLPQPKAYGCESDNELAIKEEPMPMQLEKYKFSNAAMETANQSTAGKPKKSNDEFSLDSYKKPIGYKTPAEKPTDLFSRLNESVSSIDFNNVRSYDASQVTIHKRNRTPIKTEGIGSTIPSSCSTIDSSPEDSISCSSIPKRKKYKVVPNEPIKSVLSQFEVQNKAPLTPLASSISEEQLPDDRKELLQFVKSRLTSDSYNKFLKIFLQYNGSKDYEAFSEGLFKIFGDPKLYFILKGMMRFVKPIHKDNFEKDVKNFISTNTLN